MTAEEELKKAKKIMSEIIQENIDINGEEWYKFLLISVSYLDNSIRSLEKNGR